MRVNKLGPYANPSETYPYYKLPFCAPEVMEKDKVDLGSALEGDWIMNSLYDIRFRVNETARSICRPVYTQKEVAEMREAVMKRYYFQLFVDDLPVWGFVGEVVDGLPYLFPHVHFDVATNGPHVIEVNISSDASRRVPLSNSEDEPIQVEYSYSVSWTSTDTAFAHRMDRYSRYSFFPYEVEVQWFSIMNSLFLVALLVALVSFLLVRILKRDYEKLSMGRSPLALAGAGGGHSFDESDLDDGLVSETGWKMLHGDVFRVPTFPFARSALSSMVGTGTQLLCLLSVLLLMGLFDKFNAYSRGSLYSAILVTFALTTWIAGLTSTFCYVSIGGQHWVHNCILTCLLFPLPAFVVWAFLNSVAISYQSTAALPFGTIVVLFLLYGLVSFPLSVLGAITGKRLAGHAPFEPPTRVRAVPRQIPGVPWYKSWPFTTAVAGAIPFTAIYIEISYIFASLWSHKLYTPYGIMVLTLGVLIVVAACVTVATTYFHLAHEDYRWWLRSVLTGGSAAIFIFAYCFLFLPSQSDMEGFFQVSFFFGYMFLISYAFFLILGTVGFVSSFWFIRKIYSAMKFD